MEGPGCISNNWEEFPVEEGVVEGLHCKRETSCVIRLKVVEIVVSFVDTSFEEEGEDLDLFALDELLDSVGTCIDAKGAGLGPSASDLSMVEVSYEGEMHKANSSGAEMLDQGFTNEEVSAGQGRDLVEIGLRFSSESLEGVEGRIVGSLLGRIVGHGRWGLLAIFPIWLSRMLIQIAGVISPMRSVVLGGYQVQGLLWGQGMSILFAKGSWGVNLGIKGPWISCQGVQDLKIRVCPYGIGVVGGA